MVKFLVFLIAALIGLGLVGLSFLFSSGIIWLICWAFNLIFSWKAAFGLWLLLLLISGFFKADVKVEK